MRPREIVCGLRTFGPRQPVSVSKMDDIVIARVRLANGSATTTRITAVKRNIRFINPQTSLEYKCSAQRGASAACEAKRNKSAARGGWAPLLQLLRHFLDCTYRSPIPIRHRHSEQSLSLGSQLGSTHAVRRVQIENATDQTKSFTVALKAFECFHVGALRGCGKKARVQSCRVAFRFRKRILPDSFFKVFQPQ